MLWRFRNDQPIYSQIIERISLAVVSGEYPPGCKLPSVRDLASEAGVNPNTMQRAMAELETDGLIFAQRTAGRFVTEDGEKISAVREKLAAASVDEFTEAMKRLGFTAEEIVAVITEKMKGERKNGDS